MNRLVYDSMDPSPFYDKNKENKIDNMEIKIINNKDNNLLNQNNNKKLDEDSFDETLKYDIEYQLDELNKMKIN